MYDWTLGSPIITNKVSLTNNNFYAEKTNQLSVTSENLCNRELTFNLTVTAINASLTMGNQDHDVQVDKSTLKIPFHFNVGSIHAEETKIVFFTINKNSTNFQINIISPISTTGGQCRVEGSWNNATSSYTVWAVQAPSIM